VSPLEIPWAARPASPKNTEIGVSVFSRPKGSDQVKAGCAPVAKANAITPAGSTSDQRGRRLSSRAHTNASSTSGRR
jgi:hypothetical protein